MQSIDPIASEYDDINFYIVSFDENAQIVDDYITEHGYTDVIAVEPVGSMLADLEITRQTTMIAINADGVIYYRQLSGDAGQWPQHLDVLTENPKAPPPGFVIQQEKEERQRDIQLPS
ncbi:MAG: hypothetical protein F4W95_01930 [Chloroflexi bacterium]|nr:hypothetical protein [Chloroflexota bacterium]MYD47226.1 hypothetical protein [Chloroflexota bacterium]